jgi:hypothetical protein
MMQETERAFGQVGTRLIDNVVSFLPGALVLLVLLLGALILALAVRYALLRALRGLDFDRRAELFGLSLAEWTPSRSTAQVVASGAYWAILALGLLLGLTALDAALPSRFAVAVLEYIPQLAAAMLILVVGGMLARFLARAVLIGAVNMQMQFARAMSLGVKWVVLIVAAAMALDHVGIGRTVLLLAFGIVFGGIVLATALAIGLGARDVVSRALAEQIRKPADHDKMDHV